MPTAISSENHQLKIDCEKQSMDTTDYMRENGVGWLVLIELEDNAINSADDISFTLNGEKWGLPAENLSEGDSEN